MMRNDETNGDKEENDQIFVNGSTNEEKNGIANPDRACQKCEKGKISHIRVLITKQRETHDSDTVSAVIRAPSIRYLSDSEFIVSCGELIRHFQFICDSCLRREENLKMANRVTAQQQTSTKSYRYDFILLDKSAEQISQMDQKLLQLGCKDVRRKMIRSSEQSDQLVRIHGTPIRNEQLVSSSNSPSKKSRRGQNQEQVQQTPSDGESFIEVARQRVETVVPSDVTCAHYSDKWVSSKSSSAEEETTDESIKEEGEDEYIPSGSIPTEEEESQEVVSGANDDVIVDVGEARDSRKRSVRVRRQTERYGNPICSTVRGIMHMEEETDSTVVTPEERVTQKELISRSREKEIEGWRKFDVFREISKDDVPAGAKIIISRFIESWKIANDGSRKMKSRLVVMGNQDPDQDVISTFAPTASREITLMALTLIISNGWTI